MGELTLALTCLVSLEHPRGTVFNNVFLLLALCIFAQLQYLPVFAHELSASAVVLS
jgi:hypothetical protein